MKKKPAITLARRESKKKQGSGDVVVVSMASRPVSQALGKLSMNSTKTSNSVTFYFMKNSFSDFSMKCIFPNKIRMVNRPNYI